MEEKSAEATVRELMETDDGYDAAVWSQMAEQLGLQSMIIPEEYGGQGFGYVELGIALEEMGRSLLCAPFFSTVVLAGNAIIHSGNEDAKAALLPGIADGSTIATLALAEASGRWDAEGISVEASGTGDGATITGEKMFVTDGGTANLFVVAARSEGGIHLYTVDGDAAGLNRENLSTMDQTRKQARVTFNGTPASHLCDTDDFAYISQILDLAAVALANEQVGGAQFVMDMAVQYAKDRVQFGRPIGSFQAIKHKCADMLLEVESAKSAAYYAAWCASEMNDELPSVASLSKAYCSEAYFHCAAENIQIHGGIGMTDEFDAGLYLKRARALEFALGNEAFHRDRFASKRGF